MDKADLRQGILDCDENTCDCVDDTQEVDKKWTSTQDENSREENMHFLAQRRRTCRAHVVLL